MVALGSVGQVASGSVVAFYWLCSGLVVALGSVGQVVSGPVVAFYWLCSGLVVALINMVHSARCGRFLLSRSVVVACISTHWLRP